MGRRKLIECILNPTFNEVYLQKEYDAIEYLFDGKYNHFELKEIKDLAKWERMVYIKKMPPKAFCVLCKNVSVIKYSTPNYRMMCL